MPDYGIVDTHLHLWDPGHLRYAWLNSTASLNRPHLLGDYARATQGVTVERMVFLQCECDVSQFQDEADWVAGLAQADPAFCLQPGFVEGVRLLQDYGLHFELCLKGDEQFRNALELVRRCPGVRFVLDHIGKPSIKEQRLEPWAGHLRELAALPDTWCKVSGLVSEADWQGWRISRPEERRRLFHDNAVRAYRLSD